MKRRSLQTWTLLAVGIVVLGAGCQSAGYHQREGATLGAMTGALTGAAIGSHNGEGLAGALIGGAVGAAAGGAIGQDMDAEVARNNAIIEQQMGRRLAGATTIADVVSMSRAGLSDSVITTHIKANGVAQKPTASDIIAMNQQGVSEAVLNAMQQAELPRPVSAPPAATPVIVEEHHYVAPAYPGYWGPYPPRRGRYYRNPGVHWGVSFGR